jgi:hypothetical protein
MASTTKIVSAVIVSVVGLCAFLYCDGSRGELHPPLAAQPADAREAPVAPAALDASETPATRVATTPATQAAPVAAEPEARIDAGPYVFDLTIVAIDEFIRPRSGVEVQLAPALCPLNTLGTTGWNGEWHGTWRGFEASFDAVLQLSSRFGGTAMRRVRLVAGRPQAMRIGIEPSPGGGGTRIRASVENSAEGGSRQMIMISFDSSGASGPSFATDSAGNGVFHDPGLLVEAKVARSGQDQGVPVLGDLHLIAIDTLRADAIKAVFDSKAVVPVPEKATVTGFAHDDRGAPAPGVLVTLLAQADEFRRDIRTDEMGRFVIEGVPPGPTEFYAGGDDRALVHESLTLQAADQRALDALVGKAPRARARLRTAAGEALKHWYVEARSLVDDEFLGRTETDFAGRFSLAIPRNVSVRLLAHPGTERALAKCVAAQSFAFADEEQAIVLGAESAMTPVSLALQGDARLPLDTAEVRVWRDDSGEADLLPHVTDDAAPPVNGALQPATKTERFESPALSSGGVTIEFEVPGAGWHPLGPFTLEPARGLQLGPFVLEAPAQFAPEGDAAWRTELTLRLRSQGAKIESFPRVLAAESVPLLFFAGRYELAVARTKTPAKAEDTAGGEAVASDAQHVSSRDLHAAAGEVVELKLAPR